MLFRRAKLYYTVSGIITPIGVAISVGLQWSPLRKFCCGAVGWGVGTDLPYVIDTVCVEDQVDAVGCLGCHFFCNLFHFLSQA